MKIKSYYLISVLLMVLGQVQAQQQSAQHKPAVEQQYRQLTWLEGTWTRVGTKPGRTAHERWEKPGDKSMRGWGVSLKDKDTLFVEKLQIEIKDDHVWYVAEVAENKAPVWFKMTDITRDGFTCENPAHDFPKKIVYHREGDKLLATISGDGRAMTFNFSRQIP